MFRGINAPEGSAGHTQLRFLDQDMSLNPVTPPLNHCLDFKNFSSKQTPLATFYGTDKSIFGCLNFFGWEILGLFTYKVD